MLIGTLLKTYLTVIQMLSPTLQIKLPYFMYDSMKSIVFGVILSVIQIGAPKMVRDQIDTVLEKLSNVQSDIDTKLNNLTPPLPSRPEYMKVDVSNLNNLQSILDDPVYVCSAEHRKAVDDLVTAAGSGAPAVQLLLSLMRYPHTPGMTKYLCDSKTKKSYVELLVEEGLEKEAADKASGSATTATESATPAESATTTGPTATTTPAATTATTATKPGTTTTKPEKKVASKKGGKRVLRKSMYY
jgi:hypothetical protein